MKRNDQAVIHGETARRNSIKKTRAIVLPRDFRCLLRFRPGESLMKQAAEASESVDAHEDRGESCSIMPNTAVYV